MGDARKATMEDMAGELPGLRVAPTFLDNFKQAHASPMSAWGDVIDNSRDAHATRLDIDVRSVNAEASVTSIGKIRGQYETDLVVLTDNGSGMHEDDMVKGISGLGYTDKGLETGQHYGFGATTSLPRLSDSCLVFSAREGERTVCFLSTKLQTQVHASQTVTPHCTWTDAGIVLQSETDFLSAAKRRKSLEIITAFSPFTSEADLLAEFDELGRCGTRLVLWGSLHEEHELTPDDKDIRVRGECAWPHEHSLRSYLEILYYCDDVVKPPMQIFICGKAVEPRNWSFMLWHRKEAKHYEPRVDAESNGGEKAVARLDLGYSVELEELVRVLQATSHPRKKELSAYSVRRSQFNHTRPHPPP